MGYDKRMLVVGSDGKTFWSCAFALGSQSLKGAELLANWLCFRTIE